MGYMYLLKVNHIEVGDTVKIIVSPATAAAASRDALQSRTELVKLAFFSFIYSGANELRKPGCSGFVQFRLNTCPA